MCHTTSTPAAWTPNKCLKSNRLNENYINRNETQRYMCHTYTAAAWAANKRLQYLIDYQVQTINRSEILSDNFVSTFTTYCSLDSRQTSAIIWAIIHTNYSIGIKDSMI